MLKVCLFVSLMAGGVLANFGGKHGGHKSWDRWEDSDAEVVNPPNCSCSWKHERRNGDNSSTHEERWMAKHLKANETIVEFKAKMEKQKMVCGTDGVSYADKCEFVNKASVNPTLGKRCKGPCPCEFKDEEKDSRRQHGHRSQRPICLNNGTTVYGHQELENAVKASPTIGSRCKGECSECATELKCPRGHHGHRGRRHRERRHHRESNVTAPGCTCTLSDSPWFQKFLNTSCGKRFLEKRQVCGSDNVTYANKCDFKNAQSKNTALGKRCHGTCPCDFEPKKFNNSRFDERNNSFSDNEGPRRSHHKMSKPICLNNGTTVYGHHESKDAIKSDASLGVRCKGECSECQNAPIKCPVDWVKIKQEEEKSRPKPPNCTCPQGISFGFGKFHRSRQICGNDNKTYANICELVNNQTSQPTLGFRCLGQCPCKNHTNKSDRAPKVLEDSSAEEEHDELEGTDDSSSSGGPSADEMNDVQSVEHENDQVAHLEDDEDLENEDDAVLSENETREKRNAGWEFGRHHRHHHRHHRHHRRHHRSVCLTNGQTVKGWKNVSEVFQADPGVGIRCKGHCEWCANITRCPRFPSAEKQTEIKDKMREMMQEKGRRFMEMTVESTEKPGQCDCKSPFSKRNETEETESRHGHGGWGRRHHKMKFEVCGTNNVTFKSMCEMVNNQSVDKNLGFRCHGACPCPIDEAIFDEDHEEENSTISQNFKKFLEAKGGKFAFCLTNGKTVSTKKELKAALAADKNLGTRYMNDCSVGDAGLKCPRVFRPFNETAFKSRKEFKGRDFKGKKFQRDREENGTEIEEDSNKFELNHDNRTEEQRHEEWALKKHSPSFEFRKAFDFGFGPMEHHHWGHHGGWRRHHGKHGRRHHSEKGSSFGQCMDEMEVRNTSTKI